MLHRAVLPRTRHLLQSRRRPRPPRTRLHSSGISARTRLRRSPFPEGPILRPPPRQNLSPRPRYQAARRHCPRSRALLQGSLRPRHLLIHDRLHHRLHQESAAHSTPMEAPPSLHSSRRPRAGRPFSPHLDYHRLRQWGCPLPSRTRLPSMAPSTHPPPQSSTLVRLASGPYITDGTRAAGPSQTTTVLEVNRFISWAGARRQ